MASAKKVFVVGTADTKKDELLFAADQLKAWGLPW